jgi:hypothetical protein
MTSRDLIDSVSDHLDGAPFECAVVLGLTGDRIDAIEVAALTAGEAPTLAAIRTLLQHSQAVAMVVFTDHDPPQWVVQPCYLLCEVAVTGTRALLPGPRSRPGASDRARSAPDR